MTFLLYAGPLALAAVVGRPAAEAVWSRFHPGEAPSPPR